MSPPEDTLVVINCMNYKFQSLREIRIITEWKDGCVHKTAHKEYAFVTFDTHSSDPNIQYCSPSTTLSRKLGFKTMRKVSVDTPDYVPVDLRELEN